MRPIPTLKSLVDQVRADLEAKLSSTIPVFGTAFLTALSLVQGGKLKLLYLLLGYVQKNLFVDLADDELQGGTLQRFGRVKLGRDPLQATQGVYTV